MQCVCGVGGGSLERWKECSEALGIQDTPIEGDFVCGGCQVSVKKVCLCSAVLLKASRAADLGAKDQSMIRYTV